MPAVMVVSNALAFKRALDKTAGNLIYAQAVALTKTAKQLETASNASTETAFDKPVAFTKRSAAIRPAVKSRLIATVFIKDIQAAYLEKQETGGRRLPKRRYIPVPSATRRNANGNMPRGHIKALVNSGNTFQGTVRGVTGIWQRLPGRRLALLVNYALTADYDKRFNWRRTMQREAVARFPMQYKAQLDRLFRR